MQKTRQWARIAAASGAALLLSFAMGPSAIALAHGHIEVGDYTLVIGWAAEPSFAGEPNALDLHVFNTNTKDPVTGLEDTLQVEIVQGSAKRELELEPSDEEEGAYTAAIIPTVPGDYTFHITGKIKDTDVDVEMTSGPDTFETIQDKSNASFPASESGVKSQVLIAQILGGAGVVLGLAGLVIGLTGRGKAT
jgi:hypothetical protein